MAKIFSGFSTSSGTKQTHYKVYDIDLVSTDLSQHFNTRLGERVMRPTFGCAIWDYFMEPYTDALEEQIVSEAVRICNADGRVTIQAMNIVKIQNGLRLEFSLLFNQFASIADFQVTFENRQTDLYAN